MVDLDETLLEDGSDFTTVKSVLETVAQENDQGQAFAGLVGTGAGLRGVGACNAKKGMISKQRSRMSFPLRNTIDPVHLFKSDCGFSPKYIRSVELDLFLFEIITPTTMLFPTATKPKTSTYPKACQASSVWER